MRNRPHLPRRLIPLFGLLSLYAFLITLILLVTRQLFVEAVRENSSSTDLLLPLLLVLPLPLLGALGFQFYRLHKDRRESKTGSRLKSRITGLFVLITLLASVPQGALALSFIRNSLDTWFSAGFGESLRGGLRIILDYHHDNTTLVQKLAGDSYFFRNYSELPENQVKLLWKTAQNRATNLRAFQVFSDEGKALVFQGDPGVAIPFTRLMNASNGLLPKESSFEGSLLRAYKTFTIQSKAYHLVFTLALPGDFEQTSRQLTRSLGAYEQLETYFDTFQWSLFIIFFLFSLPLFFTTVLIAFSLSDDLVRPIVNLEKATRKVSSGDYSIRILTPPHDEMGSLVESFNSMVSELSSSRSQLAQSEKISTWKEIAQQLAHELRNPLTPIRLSTERLLKRYKEHGVESVGEILEGATEAILNEVRKLDALLKGFSNFARLPSPVKESLDLGTLIENLVQTQTISNPGVRIHFDPPSESLRIFADPKQMESLMTNLVKNSMEAMNHRGEIIISCTQVLKAQDNYFRLRIQDTGPGIPKEYKHNIFNPYFTTKKDGTGLGLSIVERIVFDHGGTIWFESETGSGTTFFIDIPGDRK